MVLALPFLLLPASGFHVVEQRESGQLFSLTYARSHPPIDANTIVLSTLDRVSEHPFVRQVCA